MEYDITVAGIRILFLFLVPVVLICLVGGLVTGALQTATAIKEPALSYAGRLLALIVALYFVLPGTARGLVELLGVVLQ